MEPDWSLKINAEKCGNFHEDSASYRGKTDGILTVVRSWGKRLVILSVGGSDALSPALETGVEGSCVCFAFAESRLPIAVWGI